MDYNQIQNAASFINDKLKQQPKIGLILGSGLGVLAEDIENPVKILTTRSRASRFPL